MSSHPRIEDPNCPAHHTDDGNVTLPSSIDIATTRIFPNTPTTPIVGISEGPPMLHTSSLSLIIPGETFVQGKNMQHTSIEMLPDNTLLEIFDFYRLHPHARERSWSWHRLSHVCRQWRFVILMSPRRLGLEILCKSGASIEHILDFWETLPLIVRFKGRKTNSLPQNIGLGLSRPDRVREIDLCLTSTAVMSIVDAIKKPFQTLESIRITIKNPAGPSLQFHNAFLGGSAPCLREIPLHGISIPFPEIKQVISSTNNLVDLHISRIPQTGYFSVDALVSVLSTSTKLRQLQISFHYPASLPTLPTQTTTSPPIQRTTFPFVSFLKFHGASEYLEEFVSRVDFPSLDFMVVELFNQIFFEIPEFCCSIPLLSAFKSPSEVVISLSTKRITIYFRQMGIGGINSGICYLKTYCEQLDWKLFFVTQVSNQLSLLLKSVRTLRVIDYSPDDVMPGQEDVDSTQWVELFQPFTHVRELRATGKFLHDIIRALMTEDVAAGVLPELAQLSFSRGKFCTPAVVDAAEQFVAVRKLSGRAIHFSFGE